MVTHFDKSSKSRFGQEYQLLYRVSKKLGRGIVDLALNGDLPSLRVIEQHAFSGPKKKHALASWVEAKIAEAIAREKAERRKHKSKTKRNTAG